MPMNGVTGISASHYQVLGLPHSINIGSPLSEQQLRAAYRRALLQHHPDKANRQADSTFERSNITCAKSSSDYTVDQISEAYTTLTNPKLREQYDRQLKLVRNLPDTTGSYNKDVFRTGIETVDLDDLSYDENTGMWHRSCRCGDEKGFVVQEPDLEEASDVGQLSVGCRGCSLWLRVLFGVIEDSLTLPRDKRS